ncbi:primosomal protein N' [candidate division KSB1 bacterium]|nr:primosomal protein N' [candidate division KSB1 bacterium]
MQTNDTLIDVVLPLPIDRSFVYAVPAMFSEAIQPGIRVLIPFGRRRVTGYVIRTFSSGEKHYDFEIKKIIDVLDDKPVFTPDLMSLSEWIASYYVCSQGEALKVMLPRGMNLESNSIISIRQDFPQAKDSSERTESRSHEKLVNLLGDGRQMTIKQLQKELKIKNLYFMLNQLEKHGMIQRRLDLPQPLVAPKFEIWIGVNREIYSTSDFDRITESLAKTAPKQAICLNYLLDKADDVPRRELIDNAGVTNSSIQALINKNLIVESRQEVLRSYYTEEEEVKLKSIVLNSDQKAVKQEIERNILNQAFIPFLLHGVTGSGKTQIYIEALRTILNRGRTAIVLVPEISLTPQTVSRFKANFPGIVTVLHSHMSLGERYDSWRKLRDGTFKIAIGPRSAIFAPLENLGLIVIDEEHENTYKQSEQRPYYHARDVAVMRGKLNNAVVILGSATPSVESYFNTRIHKYQLLTLPNRVDNVPLPKVYLIDMSKQRKVAPERKNQILSLELEQKIKDRLEKHEQIIILQNRRGYSSYMRCSDCGNVEQCVNCNITLTYHKVSNRLRCHYCGYQKIPPPSCPACGSNRLEYQGVGTQQVEQSIRETFPQARVIRMDLDTVRRKRAHDRIIDAFNREKYDILLGTQMVAKGHDFDKVTLVGVISADTTLLLPDFRATERTFQLLTQVAGRAGRRDQQGEVVIQTYYPEHFGIECARTHNYMKFYASEIIKRSELGYPPYTRLIQMLIKGENEPRVIMHIKALAQELRQGIEAIDILGPVPAPLTRIKKMYRWHMIVKVNKLLDKSGKMTNEMVRNLAYRYERELKKDNLQLMIHIDPMTIL